MGEMPIGRHPVDGLVLCHGGDNNAVHQFHAAQPEGDKHGRAGRFGSLSSGGFFKPFFGFCQPFGIPGAQIFMTDPL